jgi:hypothetical protein
LSERRGELQRAISPANPVRCVTGCQDFASPGNHHGGSIETAETCDEHRFVMHHKVMHRSTASDGLTPPVITLLLTFG